MPEVLEYTENGEQYLKGPLSIFAAVGPLYSAVRVTLTNLGFTRFGIYAGLLKAPAIHGIEELKVDPADTDLPGAQYVKLVANALDVAGEGHFSRQKRDIDAQLAWGTGFALPLIIRIAYLSKHGLIANYPELQQLLNILNDPTVNSNPMAALVTLLRISHQLDKIYVESIEALKRVPNYHEAKKLLRTKYGMRTFPAIISRIDLHCTPDKSKYSTLVEVGSLVSVSRTTEFQDERLKFIRQTNKFGILVGTSLIDEIYKSYEGRIRSRFEIVEVSVSCINNGSVWEVTASYPYTLAGFTVSAGNLTHLGWFRRRQDVVSEPNSKFYKKESAMYIVRSRWNPEVLAVMQHAVLNPVNGERRCELLLNG